MQSSSSMGKGMSFGSPRKLAVLGLVLFFVGFALGGVGNQVSGALVVLPFADTITALGFVLALSAAVRAGSRIRQILIVGIVYGIGTFYVGESHENHVGSGFGLGLAHIQHISLGLLLMIIATAVSVVLAYYHTRTVTVRR